MHTDNHLKPPPDCDAIASLIPDYAFGLTDREATRLVEAGLTACPEAAAQLEDFRQLQADMRESVRPIDPPLHLENRLMAAIQTPPAKPARTRMKFHPAWLAAAAAFLLLLITNGYWIAQMEAANRRNELLMSAISGDSPETFILTSTNNLRWVRLPPAEENANAAAFLIWDMNTQRGLLYVVNFPKLAVGKTYQLWLTRDGTRESAGTFEVNEYGKGSMLFHTDVPIDNYTWARITDEPENGSPQPSGTVVAVGRLEEQTE